MRGVSRTRVDRKKPLSEEGELSRSILVLAILGMAMFGGFWLSRGSNEQSVPESPTWRDSTVEPASIALELPPMVAATPQDVRKVLNFCRRAGRGAIPDLRRFALDSSDPLVAGNAVRALGRLGAVVGDYELIGLVHDSRPRVRQEAVQALGASGNRAMLSKLVEVLESGDPELRPLVIQALGRVGGTRARTVLSRVLEDPDATGIDRTFARTALTSLR